MAGPVLTSSPPYLRQPRPAKADRKPSSVLVGRPKIYLDLDRVHYLTINK